MRAHPRSRGENGAAAGFAACVGGSSPLTRGKLSRIFVVFLCCGLIPAHAGKTLSLTRTQLRRRAHPRSRGENMIEDRVSASASGSSPLTRGKLTFPIITRDGGGLIPAHAGKTVAPRVTGVRRRAHPRSRGENTWTFAAPAPVEGSSPLTRGKQLSSRVRSYADGLIPAHAGKTSPRTRPSARCGAHPRSRGENGARRLSGRG